MFWQIICHVSNIVWFLYIKKIYINVESYVSVESLIIFKCDAAAEFKTEINHSVS